MARRAPAFPLPKGAGTEPRPCASSASLLAWASGMVGMAPLWRACMPPVEHDLRSGARLCFQEPLHLRERVTVRLIGFRGDAVVRDDEGEVAHVGVVCRVEDA